MDDTYDPDIYDLFHPPDRPDGEDSDIRFYRQLAVRTGGPVLELGAGTGRTLLPIARDGLRVYGLDSSPRMLAALRRRLADEPAEVRERVVVVEGDMREFSIPERFAMIMIPFRGFLHNVTREHQLDCLRACAQHLDANGMLAFSVFHPSLEFMRQDSDALSGVWRWRGERALPEGGFVTLSDCTSYDTVHQRLSARLKYERYDSAGRLRLAQLHRLELAYLYPRDIEGLLRESGFVEVAIEGGFDGAPFANERQELIVHARRRGR